MILLFSLQLDAVAQITVSSFPYTTQAEAYTINFGLNDGDGFDWNNSNITLSGSQSNMNIGVFGSNTNFYNITFLNSGSFTLKGTSTIQFGGITAVSASDLEIINCSFLMDVTMQDNVQYAGFIGSTYGSANFTNCNVSGHLNGKGNVSMLVGTIEYSAVVHIANSYITGNVTCGNYGSGFILSNYGTLNMSHSNHTGAVLNIVMSGASFVSVMQGASLNIFLNVSSDVYYGSNNIYSASTSIGPISGYARGGSTILCDYAILRGDMQSSIVGSTTSGRIFGWADGDISYEMNDVVSYVTFYCAFNMCCFSSTNCQAAGGCGGDGLGYQCP